METNLDNMTAGGTGNGLSVFFCLSGSAAVEIDGRTYRIEAGTGYVVMRGKAWRLADKSADYCFTETIIPAGILEQSLDINDITTGIALMLRNPVFAFDEWERHCFTHLAALCENLGDRQRQYKERFILNTYNSLLLLVCDAAARQNTAPGRDSYGGSDRQHYYFVNFLILLASHCREERNVGFYADKLCVTPKYLSSVIKEISGKTATVWIDEFVIREAKNHLKYSGKSVQEISYMLNFSTQSFFGKYFKRLTGVSPVRYKHTAASA